MSRFHQVFCFFFLSPAQLPREGVDAPTELQRLEMSIQPKSRALGRRFALNGGCFFVFFGGGGLFVVVVSFFSVANLISACS